MRRPFTVAALGLLLFGIELATGVVSLAAVRLATGAGAILAGDEFLVSASRYLGGVTLALCGAVLYGALLWTDLARHHVTAVGDLCPNCGTHTRRVRRRTWHRALSRILESRVTHRTCKRCGWSGLAA